jgi:molybdate transport system ATP-binding protein
LSELFVEVRGRRGELAIEISVTTRANPLVIVGPNGAGRTTLLLMILGALRADSGRVIVDGESLFDSQRKLDVPVERRQIGFLSQRVALFPHLDVVRNVAYGIPARTRSERLQLARSLSLSGLARRLPVGLSGGEAQRVALARAIAARPRTLPLDEPVGALDSTVRRKTRQFLAGLLRTWKIPTIVVTHDPTDATAIDGEVVAIERGAVVQKGTLLALAARPATDFVGISPRGSDRPLVRALPARVNPAREMTSPARTSSSAPRCCSAPTSRPSRDPRWLSRRSRGRAPACPDPETFAA